MKTFKKIALFTLSTLTIYLFLQYTHMKSELEVVESHSITLENEEYVLYYMYSNINGHYFLMPDVGQNNVVYLGHEDHLILGDLYVNVENMKSGKMYIGTFEDEALIKLKEMENDL